MTKTADKIIAATEKMQKRSASRLDYHDENIKNILKKPIKQNLDDWDKVARVTGKVVDVGGHVVAGAFDVSASVLLFVSKIFVIASDYILFDSHTLNYMKKKFPEHQVKKDKNGKDKKLSKFIKEHPNLAAYLSWYLMLVTAIGGIGLVKNKDKIAESIKDKVETVKDDLVTILHPEDTNSLSVSDTDSNFQQHAWDVYSNEIIKGLSFFETFRKTPRLHSGEVRYTYGPGLTWVYTVSDRGEIVQHPCTGPWKDMASRFTMEELWQQCQLHCKHAVFPSLRNAISAHDNLDDRVCVALCYAGYQGSNCIHKIAKAYSDALTTQEKMDAFTKGVVQKTARGVNITRGTLIRRWWCAAYAVGLVTSQDFLALPRDSFSKIDINKIYKDGHFICDEEMIAYALNTARLSKAQNVGEFLSGFETGRDALAYMPGDRTITLSDATSMVQKYNSGTARVKTKMASNQQTSTRKAKGNSGRL